MSSEGGALAANPSRPALILLVVASALAALLCFAPMLLLLASFGGLVPQDFGILLIAVPSAGIGIICIVFLWSAWSDLLLPRPVLAVDGTGIIDRRVADAVIPWREVTAATSLLAGHGGVVLELRSPLPTRLNPFRAGTFLFERPEPGVAHIPVRAMTVPAVTLVRAILDHAGRHGADLGEGAIHPRMPRRKLF
ncbi:MAG TPA: hypothetical protein VGN80_00890 [Devosiaceae bacterium]|jgi:hypothetical protein|nr:hypothetical protein [Devosiaceae bacterium]